MDVFSRSPCFGEAPTFSEPPVRARIISSQLAPRPEPAAKRHFSDHVGDNRRNSRGESGTLVDGRPRPRLAIVGAEASQLSKARAAGQKPELRETALSRC